MKRSFAASMSGGSKIGGQYREYREASRTVDPKVAGESPFRFGGEIRSQVAIAPYAPIVGAFHCGVIQLKIAK